MATAPSDTPRPALEGLTGLRFIAAMAVVLYHVVPELSPPRAGSAIARLTGLGYLGVSLFFVLSGFILTYTYLDRSTGTLRGSARAFWWARVARIVPVYLVALLLAFPFFLVSRVEHARSAAALRQAVATMVTAPLLLQAWWPTTACRWNCPAWSLSVEAFFYALFPLLGVWLLRRGHRALPTAIALWAAGLLAPLLYLALSPDGLSQPTPTDHGPWLAALKFNPIVHLGEFLVGIGAGVAFLGRPRVSARRGWLGWGALAAVILTAWALTAYDAVPFVVLHSGALAPLWALVVYAVAARDSVAGRLLGSRVLVRLGEYSYALFLTHGPALGYYVILVDGIVVQHPGVARIDLRLFLAAYLVSAIALARVVFRKLEEPARRAIRAWSRDAAAGGRAASRPDLHPTSRPRLDAPRP